MFLAYPFSTHCDPDPRYTVHTCTQVTLSENEWLQLDIGDLADQMDSKTELIESLDKDFDRLEAYSRRYTVRVFGLPESATESYGTIKQYVIDKVLNGYHVLILVPR